MTKKKPWFFDGSVKIDDKNEDLPILTMRIFHGDVSHNQMVNLGDCIHFFLAETLKQAL